MSAPDPVAVIGFGSAFSALCLMRGTRLISWERFAQALACLALTLAIGLVLAASVPDVRS